MTRKLTPNEESVLKEHLEQAMFIDDAPKYHSPSKRVPDLVVFLAGAAAGVIGTGILWLVGRALL